MANIYEDRETRPMADFRIRVVLFVTSERVPWNQRPLARVVHVHSSDDSIVRRVLVTMRRVQRAALLRTGVAGPFHIADTRAAAGQAFTLEDKSA